MAVTARKLCTAKRFINLLILNGVIDISTRIIHSFDTVDNWNTVNPLIKKGEIIFKEKSNGKVVLAVGNVDGGVNAADAPVVYDEDIVLGYIDEIDTTIDTATTNLNGIVSQANTDLNEIVDSAEDYVDEAKTSCANDKQSCQTIKSEVETIAGNMGNPVTNITFENGNLVIEKATGDPVTIKISSPLDAYPVGSFYFSQNSTSPATLFGGTWEQLEQGRVLLSQGTNYPAGSTGGEATHTLTVAEMPKHSHTRGTMNITGTVYASEDNVADGYTFKHPSGAFTAGTSDIQGTIIEMNGGSYPLAYLNFDASRSWTGATSEEGKSQAFNVMQPYISVYIWKRTA